MATLRLPVMDVLRGKIAHTARLVPNSILLHGHTGLPMWQPLEGEGALECGGQRVRGPLGQLLREGSQRVRLVVEHGRQLHPHPALPIALRGSGTHAGVSSFACMLRPHLGMS